MTGGAIRGEPSQAMIRVRGRVVFRHMAARAHRRGIGETASGMASRAIIDRVPIGQREEIVAGEISPPAIAHGVVALDAVRGEPGPGMVRRTGRHELITVAIDAIVAEAVEGERVVRDVAVNTAQVAVDADERESILLVQLGDAIYEPGARRMAARAVIAHGHGMHIGMAADAIGGDWRIEPDRCMARTAVNHLVNAL